MSTAQRPPAPPHDQHLEQQAWSYALEYSRLALEQLVRSGRLNEAQAKLDRLDERGGGSSCPA